MHLLWHCPFRATAQMCGHSMCESMWQVSWYWCGDQMLSTLPLVVHLCLLFFWDAGAYLQEKLRCLYPLKIQTRSYGIVTTISLGVVDEAGHTIFETWGHCNTHQGQLSLFISLPSDWNKLTSHPLLPTSYLTGQGWREEADSMHFLKKKVNYIWQGSRNSDIQTFSEEVHLNCHVLDKFFPDV